MISESILKNFTNIQHFKNLIREKSFINSFNDLFKRNAMNKLANHQRRILLCNNTVLDICLHSLDCYLDNCDIQENDHL